MKKIFVILGLSLLLQACGQKGPLYMPDPNQSSQQSSER